MTSTQLLDRPTEMSYAERAVHFGTLVGVLQDYSPSGERVVGYPTEAGHGDGPFIVHPGVGTLEEVLERLTRAGYTGTIEGPVVRVTAPFPATVFEDLTGQIQEVLRAILRGEHLTWDAFITAGQEIGALAHSYPAADDVLALGRIWARGYACLSSQESGNIRGDAFKAVADALQPMMDLRSGPHHHSMRSSYLGEERF